MRGRSKLARSARNLPSSPRLWARGIAVAALLVVSAPQPAPAAAPAADSSALSYLFRFQREPGPGLAIEARFAGGPHGFTVLGSCLMSWPGSPGCGRAVVGLTVRSRVTGELLPVDSPEPDTWTCDHRPGEPLVLQYRLAPRAPSDAEPPYLSVHADHVLFLGDAALLVPEHLVSRPSVEIRYAWAGPHAVGWTAASSFALAEREQTLRMPVRRFLHSVFFCGSAHPYQASVRGDPPLHVVWVRAEPPPEVREAVLSRLAAIRGAVARTLRQDVAGGAGICFILPGPASSVSALALGPSLLFLGDLATLAARGKGTVAGAVTTAHEFVHSYPTGRIKLVDGPVQATFLAEALSEFIGRRALLRAGQITSEEWAELVSGKLSKYAAATTSGPPHAGPEPGDGYVLGDLLVLLIDAEIRRASEGRLDILALTHLLGRPSGDGDGAGEQRWTDFRLALTALTSAAFASKIEDVLGRRARIRLADEMFAGCLRVVESPLWEFDLGFAAESSIERRRVVAVRRDGAAWRAGLRDGDVLLEWSVRWGQSDVPVRLLVSREGDRRHVSYLPRGRLAAGARQELVAVPDAPGCDQAL